MVGICAPGDGRTIEVASHHGSRVMEEERSRRRLGAAGMSRVHYKGLSPRKRPMLYALAL